MTAEAAKTTQEPDTDLRYWLANEDWYPSRYTQQWMARTPKSEAADTLAAISEDAIAEPRAPWAVAATIVASAGLATSDGIGGKGPGSRKAGTRAALMLAEMGDARAIAPLVRVFTTGGFLRSKYQEQIEAALTKLLTGATDSLELAANAPDIRTLADRIRHSHNDRGDLPEVHTNLVIAAIRVLHAIGGAENTALLRTLAEDAVSSPGKRPNRVKIQQTAASLLGQALA